MKLIPTTLLFLLFAFNAHAQTPVPSATEILEKTYQQAKKENKNVFIIFHASWCGWCRKMDSSMNDPLCKKYFADNYVTVHLTIDESPTKKNLENPGAAEFNKKYHGDKAGLPFWLIMNPKGDLLGDALVRPVGASLQTEATEGIGCPASEKEVATFIALLKKTSKLKEEELKVIGKRFRRNDG